MPLELKLRYNIFGYGNAPALALRGVADVTETESVLANVYWRWEDDPAMPWEFLGTTQPGSTLAVPFPNPSSLSVRLSVVGRTDTGVESESNIADGDQVVFTPTPTAESSSSQTAIAAATMTRGMLVDLYLDGSDLKARKADATDNTLPAEAFIDADCDADDVISVYFTGSIVRGLSGLTVGSPLYLSETAGGVTHTAPSGTGKVVQAVGTALSASSFVFEPQEPIELA